MGGGGGSTTCIKKKYTVHEIIITVHVVKINTLLCLEEEKILVRKDNTLKVYKNDYEYCRKIHKWWPCVACFVWKVKMQEYDWYMVLNTLLS